MIDLATDDTVLARFARELHADTDTTPLLAPHQLATATAIATTGANAADREAARLVWAHRIIDEYRSVAVFGELLVLLAELEAPYPALACVHRLIGDELRHARMCAAVVAALEPDGAEPLAVDLADLALPPRGPGQTRGRRAAEIIARELVVAEEESITVLAACRDAATEPAIRATLAALLRDEVRHAAAGRALLRLFDPGRPLAPAITDDERAALPAVMAADRAALRDIYRAGARGGPGRALGASLTAADVPGYF